jgi:hypothetical protein
VIATLPTGRSNWIERGLVEKATARFGILVAHLVSSSDLVEEAARSGPARAGCMTSDARVRTAEGRTQTE